jgi:transposase-like protein
MNQRERTPFEVIYYAVYLVFEGLSFRASARAIEPFIKRSHKSVWEWCQEIGQDRSFHRLFRLGRERVNVFAVDETGIKIGKCEAFLFIAYEPFQDRILGLYFTWNPNSISVEIFLRDLCRKYGRHQVWTDGADWYSLACESMNLHHHVYTHYSWMWEVTERAVQRLKDRVESFDDLFPCRSYGEKCRLKHIWNWINVFFLHHQPEYKAFIDQIKLTLR